jgi:hypothetical protein
MPPSDWLSGFSPREGLPPLTGRGREVQFIEGRREETAKKIDHSETKK